MPDSSIFAGAAIRRLRKREAKTQAAMASILGISPSYLNLIERNQRPLSARVLMRVIEQFDFDPRTLREDESIGGVDGLARRFMDERFADLAIDRDEIAEFLAAAPQAAAAFARLYDQSGNHFVAESNPRDKVRQEIQRWRNHFADLDRAAEEMADEMRLSYGEIGPALIERLRRKHQLTVRYLPLEVMPEAICRLDLHARQLQLSEMLDPASRNFQIAAQIVRLEHRQAITDHVAGAKLDSEEAALIYERHLIAYFAAALMMPYGRFLRGCEQSGYDVLVLQRRFGTNFEQVAHRLTTLQRVGQRGLPFFMVRIDSSGSIAKLLIGASEAAMFEHRNVAAKWAAQHNMQRDSALYVQSIVESGVDQADRQWFTMSQAVDGIEGAGDARSVIAVGIEARMAGDLAAAKIINLDPSKAQIIAHHQHDDEAVRKRLQALPPRGTVYHVDRVNLGPRSSKGTYGT